MQQKIYSPFKGNDIKGSGFSPCVTDGLWTVSRWDILHTDTRKRAVYFFGIDEKSVALYKQGNHELNLPGLVYDTLIREIDSDNGDFKSGEFRYEYDGEKFTLCEVRPKWADYDCGTIDE